MTRRLLQATTAVMALIPVATGVLTMMGIYDPIYRTSVLPSDALLDGNLRFFGGVWLALGLAMGSLVPRIEREGRLFAVLWGAVFLGGVGRALSMAFLGLPPRHLSGSRCWSWWVRRPSSRGSGAWLPALGWPGPFRVGRA